MVHLFSIPLWQYDSEASFSSSSDSEEHEFEHEAQDLDHMSSRKRTLPDPPAHASKRPRFSILSKPIKVVVGKEGAAAEYAIHEDLLRKHSDFAVAAMNGKWRESDERTIYFVDDEPLVFEVFANFVYSGEIWVEHTELAKAKFRGPRFSRGMYIIGESDGADEGRIEGADAQSVAADIWTVLAKCYLLGDKVLSNSFKSAVADAMAERFSDFSRIHQDVPFELYKLAYEETSGDNGFKRLVVDMACCAWEETDYAEVDRVDFLREVAMVFHRDGGRTLYRERLSEHVACEYHDHDEGGLCYLDMF